MRKTFWISLILIQTMFLSDICLGITPSEKPVVFVGGGLTAYTLKQGETIIGVGVSVTDKPDISTYLLNPIFMGFNDKLTFFLGGEYSEIYDSYQLQTGLNYKIYDGPVSASISGVFLKQKDVPTEQGIQLNLSGYLIKNIFGLHFAVSKLIFSNGTKKFYEETFGVILREKDSIRYSLGTHLFILGRIQLSYRIMNMMYVSNFGYFEYINFEAIELSIFTINNISINVFYQTSFSPSYVNPSYQGVSLQFRYGGNYSEE